MVLWPTIDNISLEHPNGNFPILLVDCRIEELGRFHNEASVAGLGEFRAIVIIDWIGQYLYESVVFLSIDFDNQSAPTDRGAFVTVRVLASSLIETFLLGYP